MIYKEVVEGLTNQIKAVNSSLVFVMPNKVDIAKTTKTIRVTSVPFEPVRLELRLAGMRRYSGIIEYAVMSPIDAGTSYGESVYDNIYQALFGQIIITTNHQINILNISVGNVDLVNSQSGPRAQNGFMYPILVEWESFN